MNLSGESIRPLMDYFQIEIEDIVVIYDDLDLPVGKIRLRQKEVLEDITGLNQRLPISVHKNSTACEWE